MECPECGNSTMVLDSRKYAGAVYRRRKCKTCHFKFWTEELEIESSSQMPKNVQAYCKMKYREKCKSKTS